MLKPKFGHTFTLLEFVSCFTLTGIPFHGSASFEPFFVIIHQDRISVTEFEKNNLELNFSLEAPLEWIFTKSGIGLILWT